MKELTGGPISPAKTAQATLSAITACDAADGVMDGVIGEPRSCKFSAKGERLRRAEPRRQRIA